MEVTECSIHRKNYLSMFPYPYFLIHIIVDDIFMTVYDKNLCQKEKKNNEK
jgi:hypothetical protein